MKRLLFVLLAAVAAAVAAAVYLRPVWLARIQLNGRAPLSDSTRPTGAPPPTAYGGARAGESALPGSSASAAAPAADSAASLPFTESTTNIAAEEMGDHVDQATGSYGSGYFGKRLIDGSVELAWTSSNATFPQEAVFSFYNREPALIAAVTIVLPVEAASAPKDVEVWTSREAAPDQFVKAASQTLTPQPAEQKVAFAPVEARYVKLRILSGASSERVGIRAVRILEALRAGYVPLFSRYPEIASWNGSPRQAGQRGLDWLQQAAVDWQKLTDCFGCHVQAQVIMGQAIAFKTGLRRQRGRADDAREGHP